MSAPRVRPHVTYDELCRLPPDGHRYELIEGEPYMTPSPNLRHQFLVQRLFLQFHGATTPGSHVIVAPLDVVLAEDTAVQPDVIVVLERSAGIMKDVIRGVPDLAVEVLSPSTAYRDRGVKLAAFARHRLPEYWIVDDDQQQIEIRRIDRSAPAYPDPVIFRPGQTATMPLLPRLAVDVTALLAD